MTDQVVDSDSVSATIPEPLADLHQGWVGADYRPLRAGAKIRHKGNVGVTAR